MIERLRCHNTAVSQSFRHTEINYNTWFTGTPRYLMCRGGKTHKHKKIITVLTKTATQETINCSIPEEIQVTKKKKKKKPGKLSSLIEFSASVKCWDETLQSILQLF